MARRPIASPVPSFAEGDWVQPRVRIELPKYALDTSALGVVQDSLKVARDEVRVRWSTGADSVVKIRDLRQATIS